LAMNALTVVLRSSRWKIKSPWQNRTKRTQRVPVDYHGQGLSTGNVHTLLEFQLHSTTREKCNWKSRTWNAIYQDPICSSASNIFHPKISCSFNGCIFYWNLKMTLRIITLVNMYKTLLSICSIYLNIICKVCD